jgi:hypothetical protein
MLTEVRIRDFVPIVVYFVLPFLSAGAWRRHWTDIALLDQWCDVISVAIMVAYTAITVRVLVRRGEIVVPLHMYRRGSVTLLNVWRAQRVTIRKCDNSEVWPGCFRITNRQYFWWLVAMYPVMCAVATFFVLIPRIVGRN